MSVYITKEDITDDNGVLLLKKNQKVNDDVIKKLKRFSRSIVIDAENNAIYNGKIFDSAQKDYATKMIIHSFGTRKHIVHEQILETPHKVLTKILFESKKEPWWIYINTLANYLGWLYTHSIDVALMSLIIAVKLGYGEKNLFYIGLGSLLHDVGKLLLPKSMIERTEPFNKTEQLIFYQHCELGLSSVETYNLPKECTDIILQHHERLDGSGYPKGLKESKISQSSKIVMIADALDRMTSERPDGQGVYEMDEAIAMMKKEKKFSYDLVSLLEKALQQ
jgi:putative nucleotidyltransferase with HDIG domain